MNYTELSNYLASYLQTNDPDVLDNIPNFLTLAASRIAVDVRGALVERTATLLNTVVQPLPTGTQAVQSIRVNGVVRNYVPLNTWDFNIIGYTIQAGVVYLNPAPEPTDTIYIFYYAANSDSILADNLPHLFLHGGAYEAEMYQGNNDDARDEMALYQVDLRRASGWDVQSGPISLSGNTFATTMDDTLAVETRPIAAIDVTYTQTGNVFSTNVQNAITEVASNLSTHVSNQLNPHNTTINQVIQPGDTGDVLQVDSNGEWVSAPPLVISVFGRDGDITAQASDYSAFYAPINSGVLSFNGRAGAVMPAGNDYTLNLLSDVVISSPLANQVLAYNGTQWLNVTNTASPVTSVFTRTGAITAQASDYSAFYATTAQGTKADTALQPTSSINALADVSITTAAVNNNLTYNGTNWVNSIPVGIDKIQAVTTPSIVNLDLGGYLTYTATGANTWAFTTSVTTGFEVSWTLELTNGGIAPQTFTDVKWANSIPPALTVTGTDILVFTKNCTTGVIRGYVAARDSK